MTKTLNFKMITIMSKANILGEAILTTVETRYVTEHTAFSNAYYTVYMQLLGVIVSIVLLATILIF